MKNLGMCSVAFRCFLLRGIHTAPHLLSLPTTMYSEIALLCGLLSTFSWTVIRICGRHGGHTTITPNRMGSPLHRD